MITAVLAIETAYQPVLGAAGMYGERRGGARTCGRRCSGSGPDRSCNGQAMSCCNQAASGTRRKKQIGNLASSRNATRPPVPCFSIGQRSPPSQAALLLPRSPPSRPRQLPLPRTRHRRALVSRPPRPSASNSPQSLVSPSTSSSGHRGPAWLVVEQTTPRRVLSASHSTLAICAVPPVPFGFPRLDAVDKSTMFRPFFLLALAAASSLVVTAQTYGKGFTGKKVLSAYFPSYQMSPAVRISSSLACGSRRQEA